MALHSIIEQGSGAPLLLLHAFPLSGAMWRREIPLFAPFLRVIAPDLPGFGRSPRAPQPSIAAMAQQAAEVLDRLHVQDPVVLAGLSMGGYVAFEFLRQFPRRVRALALWSTKAAADTPEQQQGRFKLIERVRQEGSEALIQATFPKLLGRTAFASQPAVVAEVEQAVRDASPDGVIDALRAMAQRSDSRPLLPSISCPTLVLAGAEDAVIPPQESEAMAQAIRGARFETIPEAGHLLNLERPEAFHECAVTWIQQVVKT
ncbi:MAG: alpha/beta hydrolase [Candidatus Omnitrophica bacterium CG11_big_fil_rev_8_21_14_0_20_63_9]|nr:MAG: alpha/beta hydrolase [Candidatus Omnitrophica bacterium CG11_big_fil_rev_8_21_14_0_20_63_9]